MPHNWGGRGRRQEEERDKSERSALSRVAVHTSLESADRPSARHKWLQHVRAQNGVATHEAADGVAAVIKQLSERSRAARPPRLLSVESVEDEVEEHEETGEIKDPRGRGGDEIGTVVLVEEVARDAAHQRPRRQLREEEGREGPDTATDTSTRTSECRYEFSMPRPLGHSNGSARASLRGPDQVGTGGGSVQRRGDGRSNSRSQIRHRFCA